MYILILLIVQVYSYHTFSENSKVKTLNQTEFQQLNIGRDSHSWFILFYRPSCPHCQKVLPVWESFAEHNQTLSKIGAVNCEVEKDLCKLFSIDAVPTMILISEGGNLHHYSGNRTKESFIQFLDKNWQNNETETPPKEDFSIFDTTTIFILLLLVLVGFLIWIYFQEKYEYSSISSQANQSSIIEMQEINKPIEI
ncbi:unnamed protein product [Paramecium octaurelia]|uniref:Thioredoxin domain-containing protein n=1 Tax=Paramecium octaurelia TaxID=43137 RepID=A0A8S1W3B2_PAROT|nr:unnamed protein product [Paramecium octaurelia]